VLDAAVASDTVKITVRVNRLLGILNLVIIFLKKVAQALERTWDLSISLVLSFNHLTPDPQRLPS
jgi:hypothetical protein